MMIPKILYQSLLQKKEHPESMTPAEIFDLDLTAAVQLLQDGMPLKDTLDALKELSPMASRTDGDAQAMSYYLDKVLDRVNLEQRSHSANAYDLATESYKAQVVAYASQFQHYAPEDFGLFEEGHVALSLMRKDGFSPEIVEAVIKKQSVRAKNDSTYLSAVMNATKDCLDAYRQIDAIDPSTPVETAQEAYRLFAKNYATRTNTIIFSAQDEQAILQELADAMLQQYKNRAPIAVTVETQKRYDADIEAQIKPFLESALKASPVSLEAGRDRDQYISALLLEFSSDYETKRNLSSKRYPLTKAMYLEKSQTYHDRRNLYDSLHEDSFYDAQIAKELLQEKQGSANIVRAITENSAVAHSYIPEHAQKGSSEYQEGLHQAEQYAKETLEMAKKSLHAEKAILSYEPKQELPKTASYQQLKSLGITPRDLYLSCMQEGIKNKPSFILELSEPATDRDIVEKICYRYPDVPRPLLRDAIMEASPRIFLPGAPYNYVDRLFDQVDARLQKVAERHARENQDMKTLKTMRGLASRGAQIQASEIGTYKDGRIAMKLLRQGRDEEDITRFLLTMARSDNRENPHHYAVEVMGRAKKSVEREEKIRTYQKPAEPLETPSFYHAYLMRMQNLYEQKGFVQSESDVEAITDILIKEGKTFRKADLQNGIAQYSPIAVEPGRDEKYAQYVTKESERRIKEAEDTLAHYLVILRPDAGTAEDEYAYQMTRLKDATILPYSEEMDEKIGQALLRKYPEETVEEAMTKKSLLKDTQPSYGKYLLSRIHKKEKQRKEQQEADKNISQALQRSLRKDHPDDVES